MLIAVNLINLLAKTHPEDRISVVNYGSVGQIALTP
jgi:hypothetical protein